MVERARLTPKFVFEAMCPTKGERWIADTKIRGFGLRLWSNKAGGHKAFAIRVSTHQARKIRKTFDARRSQWVRPQMPIYGLGDYLDEARRWAQREIDQAKGYPVTSDELKMAPDIAKQRIRHLTLQDGATALLSNIGPGRASEQYSDRLRKLFDTHLPNEIKQTSLENLDPKLVARTLVRSNASPGNARTLRSFISQIFEHGAIFHGPLALFPERLAQEFSDQWRRNRDVRFPELRRLNANKYQELFAALESEETYWQQAMAIRLYFAFHAPLCRILSGQWSQIHSGHWYPYWPDEKGYWFECRENLEGETAPIFERIRRHGTKHFEICRFWFPSRHARAAQHIRTVEYTWKSALRAVGIPHFPLREFSKSFREFNNPSYYGAFYAQHQSAFRRAQNVAQVSKALMMQRNSRAISIP